jgi:predicted transcriptional regulator
MSALMQSHDIAYQGDGRTIAKIARELGLTDQMIEVVQRDADKPDKIAMNVWRKLCPTIEDKVFVRSIKRVPVSTLDNIYGKFF